MQSDPTGSQDDTNVYAYVANEPSGLIDPTGEGAKIHGFAANPTPRYGERYAQAERTLFATASAVNARDVNLVMMHGDSRGLYSNFDFQFAMNSTPVSRQLMASPGFDKTQPTILAACNAARTITPANMAIETGTMVLAPNGFAALQGFRDGTLRMRVNIESGSGKGDGAFVEYASTGVPTGREFSEITINADGSVTYKGAEARTGTRLLVPTKVECDSKGKCKP